MRAHQRVLLGGTAGLVFAWYMVSLVKEGMSASPWSSARACVNLLFLVLIIVWPLVGGIGAADAVLVTRSERLTFVESLPPAGRSRLVMGRVALVWTGAIAGTVAACVVAAVVGFAHGSGWTWGALSLLPYALTGSLAFSAVGYALGLAIRSWFVPPVVLLGGYALGAIPSTAFLESYAGAYPPVSVFAHPTWFIYGPLCAGWALLAISGVVGLAARWSRARAATAALMFIAGVAAIVVARAAMTPDTSLWVDDNHDTLACRVADEGPAICVPPDLPHDAPLVAAQLAPLLPRAVALDPALREARWVPGKAGAGELSYQLPVGRNLSTWEQAQAVAGAMSAECAKTRLLTTGDVPAALPTDTTTVAAWLSGDQADAAQAVDSGVQLPVLENDARAAYSRIATCAY